MAGLSGLLGTERIWISKPRWRAASRKKSAVHNPSETWVLDNAAWRAASKPNASLGEARLADREWRGRANRRQVAFMGAIGETGVQKGSSSEERRLPASEASAQNELASYADAGGAPLSPPDMHDLHFNIAGQAREALCCFVLRRSMRRAIVSCIGAMTRDLDRANLGQDRLRLDRFPQ